MISILGFVAATLTTIAFLPQVIKTLKTKRTKDISLPMYFILTMGLFSWFVYGITLQDYPIILANGLTFILAAIILVLKIRNG